MERESAMANAPESPIMTDRKKCIAGAVPARHSSDERGRGLAPARDGDSRMMRIVGAAGGVRKRTVGVEGQGEAIP